MSSVSIDDILALDDSHRRMVKVPEWNDAEICVASMTAVERGEIEKRWGTKEAASDPTTFRMDVLTQSLKAKDGAAWGSPEKIKQLMTKNAAAVERLFEAACEVNGFTKKDVDELGKN